MKKKAIVLTLTAGLVLPTIPVHVSAATPVDQLGNQFQDLKGHVKGKIPQSVIDLYNKEFEKLKANPSANLDLVSDTWSKISAKKGNASGYDKLTKENILKLFLEFADLKDPKNSSDVEQLINDPDFREIVDQLVKLGGFPGGLNEVKVNDAVDTVKKFIDAFNLTDLIQFGLSGKDGGPLKTNLDNILNDNNLKFSKVLKGLGITSDDLLNDAKRLILKFLAPSDNGGTGGTGGSFGYYGTGGTSATPPSGGADGVKLGDNSATIERINEADGKVHIAYKFSQSDLESALDILKKSDQQQKTLIVNAGKEKADIIDINLPAAFWLKTKQSVSAADILVQYDGATFRVPFSGIGNLEELVERVGVKLDDAVIKITLKKVTGAVEATIKDRLKEGGYDLLSGLYDFSISVEGGGKSIDISSFGNLYSTRSISLSDQTDPSQTTGVTYDEQAGQLLFVPTIFQGSTANIRRTGSSVYAVVKGKHTFSDIGSHWAKADIELLASKLIVKGATDTAFAPEEKVTRSEFASLIVRALGIKDEPFKAKFTDVKESDWHAGSVIAAYRAGLLDGFEDGSFRPNDLITRQQAAVILARAVAFAGQHPAGGSGYLAKYADKSTIADWALDAVSKDVEAGIIEGITDSTIAPNEYATRAQAVAVIKRLLQYVKFIN